MTAGLVVIHSDDTGDAVFRELDSDGRYEATDLQPGQYRVSFDDNLVRQYAFGKLTFFDADLIEVVAGQTTIVNDEKLPTGTLSGRLTQADGTTPASADVVAHLADSTSQVARTFTDGDGRWRLDVPAPTTRFVPVPRRCRQWIFATQWARQKVSQNGADVFTVNVGEEMIVDESLLPVGSISGRFTDHDGQPIAGGNVNISDLAGNFVAHADTDDAGAYSFPALLAASYVMEFANPDFSRVQYARGKPTRETADPIAVVGGENTVVDEQFLAPGAIRVQARDADTGALIRNICVISATRCRVTTAPAWCWSRTYLRVRISSASSRATGATSGPTPRSLSRPGRRSRSRSPWNGPPQSTPRSSTGSRVRPSRGRAWSWFSRPTDCTSAMARDSAAMTPARSTSVPSIRDRSVSSLRSLRARTGANGSGSTVAPAGSTWPEW